MNTAKDFLRKHTYAVGSVNVTVQARNEMEIDQKQLLLKWPDIKVKLSTFGVFATLLLLITLNIYQQEESTDVNEVINYMFEDNYLAAGTSTYDYVDLY